MYILLVGGEYNGERDIIMDGMRTYYRALPPAPFQADSLFKELPSAPLGPEYVEYQRTRLYPIVIRGEPHYIFKDVRLGNIEAAQKLFELYINDHRLHDE